MGIHLLILSFDTKICIYMYFFFNPFVFTMYHCTSMLTQVCICAQCHVCRCARTMQIRIPMIAEVKVFQRYNMLSVHHMHTLVCKVFKWNYEQHLYGNTSLPAYIRFARANAPLKWLLKSNLQVHKTGIKIENSAALRKIISWLMKLHFCSWHILQ